MHIQRELQRFLVRAAMDQWAQDLVVVSGGQWPRERQRRAGYDSDELCQRCCSAPESLFHRVWECPCNVGHKAYEASEHLVAQARAGVEQDPALWLRGVCPVALTTPTFDESKAAWVELVGATFDSLRETAADVVHIFGDGSGGARRTLGGAASAPRPSS